MLKQPSHEYRGFRAGGIRLGEEMLPELGRLYSSRTRPMLPALHAFDKAHAVMLCEEGLLCEERGLGPDAVTPDLLDEAATLYHGEKAGLDAATIAAALDPRRFIASRTLQGGPAPAESLRQADLLEAQTARDAEDIAAIRVQLAEAERKLEEAIDRILA